MTPDRARQLRARQLRERRDEIKAKIAQVEDLRPGSLVERYRQCGKPTCHCAREGDAGHGPSWSLTREVAGKTITTVIPAAAVETTRHQVAEYKRLRSLTKELVETSEKLCDVQLRATEAPAEAEAKKGGSKRSLRTRSRKKSKR